MRKSVLSGDAHLMVLGNWLLILFIRPNPVKQEESAFIRLPYMAAIFIQQSVRNEERSENFFKYVREPGSMMKDYAATLFISLYSTVIIGYYRSPLPEALACHRSQKPLLARTERLSSPRSPFSVTASNLWNVPPRKDAEGAFSDDLQEVL